MSLLFGQLGTFSHAWLCSILVHSRAGPQLWPRSIRLGRRVQVQF